MSGIARIKAVDGAEACYHLYSRVAGVSGYYPLAEKASRAKMVRMLRFYTGIYKMRLAGFSIMGNHYHLVVEFLEFEELSREELKKIAARLYHKNPKFTALWGQKEWERFNRRLYDVSEFMRNLQAEFARWFNFTHKRRGRFWAERFKSTLLEDRKDLLDCLYYVELNAVRAGIVELPEDYTGSSLYYREVKDDRFMISLKELMQTKSRSTALCDYRAGIYYRGSVRSKMGQKEIPEYIIKREEALGFRSRGVYAKRTRHFVDGLVVGSREYVSNYLEVL